ncbi:MAG: SUMF1/EgtB/PvdO family nonheme iron enzyme [Phycisphaerales bacterium]|nr:SUMF1/EgtB/PvdO family nonheme iron enzyme [Phycisphaerales bacterium]
MLAVCGVMLASESNGRMAWDENGTLEPETFEQELPSTPSTIRMVRVPGDAEKGVVEVWMSATEVAWDAYDVFLYRLDDPQGEGADAIARPSKPYVPPDRGYGHAGYPAIGMTRQGAEAFCVWLSEKSGRTYRLPTIEEWRHACSLGGQEANADTAWTLENSDRTTHPIATRAASTIGLHDMLGNAAEWVSDASQKRAVALGGSFLHDASEASCDALLRQDSSWNASDPQIPKSKWWLPDAPFVGFRVVCEGEKE